MMDILVAGADILVDEFLTDQNGTALTTGAATARVLEEQADGTFKSLDFNDHTFKTTALTTPTLALTHRTTDNATYSTGCWTGVITGLDLAAFTAGRRYWIMIAHASSSPPVIGRYAQYGHDAYTAAAALPDAGANAAAVVAHADFLKVLAQASGKVVKTDDAYAFYAANNTDVLFTLTYAAGERTRS